MRPSVILLVITVGLLFTCKTAEDVMEIGDTVTVEAESLTLKDAEIVSDSAASGSKAVMISHITSVLSGSISLPVGVYEVKIFENAPDRYTDAIYLQINGLPPLRTYSPVHGTYAECNKTVTFSVENKDVPVSITITPSEVNMKIDKLVFEKLE
jgi:hypothetical protein